MWGDRARNWKPGNESSWPNNNSPGGAVLRCCRAIVCVDSGLQHIAAMVGTKCVTLMAARDIYGSWHPDGRHIVLERRVQCHTCFVEVCPHDNLCMREISVDDVKEAVGSLLGRSGVGSG
ncbi:glycosyltransferase family 9 protein [Candidatus Nitrospira inopinata]|nr:glycosyltransferase family 9 protein [Candidatus Nitrospira inopinata]